MVGSIFKAYDIRGRYPEEINETVILKITSSLVKKLWPAGKVIIGHDARLSSPRLYEVAKKRLAQNSKLEIIEVGLVTTPMLYFLVNYFKAVGGFIITASHNPPKYNGLKVVGQKAEPISGKAIYKLING